MSDVNFSVELGSSLCHLRAAAPLCGGNPGQLLWRTWNRTWEGLGGTCVPLQKSLFPPACLLHRLCVPPAAAQHLDLCLALSMLGRHHSLNSSTLSTDHWEGAQELCPAGHGCGQLWKPSGGAEMLQEVGGEGQDICVQMCSSKRAETSVQPAGQGWQIHFLWAYYKGN